MYKRREESSWGRSTLLREPSMGIGVLEGPNKVRACGQLAGIDHGTADAGHGLIIPECMPC